MRNFNLKKKVNYVKDDDKHSRSSKLCHLNDFHVVRI